VERYGTDVWEVEDEIVRGKVGAWRKVRQRIQ